MDRLDYERLEALCAAEDAATAAGRRLPRKVEREIDDLKKRAARDRQQRHTAWMANHNA